MINIVIPLAGKSSFFKEDEIIFPKPFMEKITGALKRGNLSLF